MQELYAFVQQMGVQLTPEMQQDILNHALKHQGYLYGQLHGVVPPSPPASPPNPPMSAALDQTDQNVTSHLSQNQSNLLGQIIGAGQIPQGQ